MGWRTRKKGSPNQVGTRFLVNVKGSYEGKSVDIQKVSRNRHPQGGAPLFQCMECRRKFYTLSSAEKASNNGCPGCGGVDIDEYVEKEVLSMPKMDMTKADKWLGTDTLPFQVSCPHCGTVYSVWGKSGDMKTVKCDECGQEFIRTLREESKSQKKSYNMKRYRIKDANKQLGFVNKQYFNAIPLEKIFHILKDNGAAVLQEDYTDWSGFLTGEDGRANFTLGSMKSAYTTTDVAIGKLGTAYVPYRNVSLVLTWHKMPSGKYEVGAYVS